MQHKNITKYQPFPAVDLPDRQWPNRRAERAPAWCSVDLRDGNQALSIPMSVGDKTLFFQTLAGIGFEEIEIGFPSASEIEFDFARHLIENKLVPENVTVQVLVQAREHLIRRTYEALRGFPRAIVHFYNSTNPLQRRVTFGMEKEEIKQMAVDAARLIKELAATIPETDVRYQYSPESFSDTEMDYALEVCEAVMETLEPSPEKPVILNLPVTVEMTTPNVHADQIEWFCRNMKERDKAVISLHAHNDRGTGVAATELSLMAGAQRVEGTLFGNGERTGNVDIVTLALNMYSQGVDPGLDFSDLPKIRNIYERCTRMTVHDRHPYAGDLVFTAFSGSHQDAIKKGMDKMQEKKDGRWEVPYLPIDPADIGRAYQAIIRINSQSGKGGVAYVLDREFGFDLPKKMRPEFGEVVNRIADEDGIELTPQAVRDIFGREYLKRESPLRIAGHEIGMKPDDPHKVTWKGDVIYRGEPRSIEGHGNGPIAAFIDALKAQGWKDFRLLDFRQHAITQGSAADAAAYVLIERAADARPFWGAGVDSNIEMAGLKAVLSAFNRAHAK